MDQGNVRPANAEGPGTSPPSTTANSVVVFNERTRYLRACDRCRSRKVKCDHNNPCSKCHAARVSCVFTSPSVRLLRDVIQPDSNNAVRQNQPPEARMSNPTVPVRRPSDSNNGMGQDQHSEARKRRRTDEEDQAGSSGMDHLELDMHDDGDLGFRQPLPTRSDSAVQPLQQAITRGHLPRTAEGGSAVDGFADRVLDHSETAHFFQVEDGTEKFCGSTSGLPLLDATRRLMSVQSDLFGQKTRSTVPDWDFISSLLSGDVPCSGSGRGDPNRMIMGGQGFGSGGDDAQQAEEAQYFPGKSQTVEGDAVGAFVQLTSVIPPALLAHLLDLYFQVVHPRWPFIDKVSFYGSLDLSMTSSLAALCTVMCMIASRYSKEPSVLGEPNDPASAGIQFIGLFTRFRQQATNRDDTVIATQTYLLASMYHCVDHLPHTLAHGFLGEAVARCYDGGLHRETSSLCRQKNRDWESTKRTAWAVFCWDKQLAAICGRPPLMRLYDFDVSLPATIDASGSQDRIFAIFNQFVLLCALLEKTLAASIQRPVFDNSRLLTKLSEESEPKQSREDALPVVERNLKAWFEELPDWIPRSMDDWTTMTPQEAMSIYELKSTLQLIRLLIAGRHMQLATSDRLERPDDIDREGPQFSTFREKVQHCAKALISTCIALGSNNLLHRADIMLAYKALLAGRMLISTLLSAQVDHDHAQAGDATRALQAAGQVLHHFARLFPIALGSSEVLYETCRVCGADIQYPPVPQSMPRQNTFAWYRPIAFKPRWAYSPSAAASGPLRPIEPSPALPMSSASATWQDGLGLGSERPDKPGIQSKKNSPLPFDLGIPYSGILGDNLEWLFPGGMPAMDAT